MTVAHSFYVKEKKAGWLIPQHTLKNFYKDATEQGLSYVFEKNIEKSVIFLFSSSTFWLFTAEADFLFVKHSKDDQALRAWDRRIKVH